MTFNNKLPLKEETNLKKDWIFLVGRPYTLFGASLYQYWFDSPYIFDLLGVSIPDNLYVEEHPNVVRRYVIKNQLNNFSNTIKNLVLNNSQKTKAILETGLSLNKEAKKHIKKLDFSSLESAVNFLVQLSIHTAVFSYFSYPIIKEQNNQKLIKLVETLRTISYYPKVIEHIINPLAQEKFGEDYNFITISEMLRGDTSSLEARKKSAKKKRFIYSKIRGQETISYVPNVLKIIQKLEKLDIKNTITGQAGYPGKVIGRVRLVLNSDINIEFNKGDILVAVTSNPILMPLIRKCGAIVTDEGGITSHAAIVSRELKKPCVIGTKFATHTFKEGDLVEVDANKGIVKKITS